MTSAPGENIHTPQVTTGLSKLLQVKFLSCKSQLIHDMLQICKKELTKQCFKPPFFPAVLVIKWTTKQTASNWGGDLNCSWNVSPPIFHYTAKQMFKALQLLASKISQCKYLKSPHISSLKFNSITVQTVATRGKKKIEKLNLSLEFITSHQSWTLVINHPNSVLMWSFLQAATLHQRHVFTVLPRQ